MSIPDVPWNTCGKLSFLNILRNNSISLQSIRFQVNPIFTISFNSDGYWNTKNCWIPEELENGSLSVAPNNDTTAAVEEFWK